MVALDARAVRDPPHFRRALELVMLVDVLGIGGGDEVEQLGDAGDVNGAGRTDVDVIVDTMQLPGHVNVMS